jgi:hypothetical protein
VDALSAGWTPKTAGISMGAGSVGPVGCGARRRDERLFGMGAFTDTMDTGRAAALDVGRNERRVGVDGSAGDAGVEDAGESFFLKKRPNSFLAPDAGGGVALAGDWGCSAGA